MAHNDMKAANETYAGFVNLVKWGAISIGIVTVVVIGLISSHA